MERPGHVWEEGTASCDEPICRERMQATSSSSSRLPPSLPPCWGDPRDRNTLPGQAPTWTCVLSCLLSPCVWGWWLLLSRGASSTFPKPPWQPRSQNMFPGVSRCLLGMETRARSRHALLRGRKKGRHAASRQRESGIRALRSNILFPFAHFPLQSFAWSQALLPGSW